MGCESSPEDASYRVFLLLLSFQYYCLLLLVLNPLSWEEPTLIQLLPTTLIMKLSKTHARQPIFSGILLLVLFFGVTMLTKQASLPRWLSRKESACSAGDLGSIPASERFPGGGHGNPLQYSCLENPHREELGRLQSVGLQRDTTEPTEHAHMQANRT